MENLWYQLILSVLSVLSAIALSYLTVWLKSKYSAEQIAQGKEIAKIAVTAVEKIAESMGWHGQEKYEMAVKYLQELAKKIGLYFSEDQIKALIEAAVKELDKAWEGL